MNQTTDKDDSLVHLEALVISGISRPKFLR